MQLISKYNEGFCFYYVLLMFIVNIHGLFLWKAKKCIKIINASQKILNESNRKLNKIWVQKGSKFYNSSMKSWLHYCDIEKYSTHNEGNSVFAERFSKNLKNKFTDTWL